MRALLPASPTCRRWRAQSGRLQAPSSLQRCGVGLLCCAYPLLWCGRGAGAAAEPGAHAMQGLKCNLAPAITSTASRVPALQETASASAGYAHQAAEKARHEAARVGARTLALPWAGSASRHDNQ